MSKKLSAPICECEEIHRDLVNTAREEMPDAETLYDLAIDKRPMCVCDIADLLGMTRSAVSHQIKTLRQASLVTYRKSGKNVIYRLADDHVRDIIETALLHIGE